MALWASHASADGIVLESFTGTRPDDATRLLAPIHAELEERSYGGGARIGRLYERRVSRSATSADGLTPDFDAGIERGHKAWIAGRFDEAISVLVPLVASARAHPTSISQSQAQRDKLLKAYIALALSHQRKGDLAEARAVLTEMIRTYPDTQVPRSIYGPDAYQFYDEVRRATGGAVRGTLSVKVPDNAVVFINERFDRVGAVTHADLIPGVYRVFSQLSKGQVSRVHNVDVRADEETVLTIDPQYERVIQTTPVWTGLLFATADDREKHEVAYAARFAKEIAATSVIVIGIDKLRGRSVVVGSLIDMSGTREIRRASLALEPAPSEERLRTLARFLASGDSAEGLDVELGAPGDKHDMAPVRGNARAWMLWVGIGAIVVGGATGGVLAIKFRGDASDAADELDRTCAVSCTPAQATTLEHKQNTANRNALVSAVVGGAVVATGITFIILSRLGRGRSSSTALTPIPGGGLATFVTAF